MISGILCVDKALGWTSHDVVARVRRAAGQRQVGHAGTLDPLATGVLLLVLGHATRLSSHLMDTTKVYCAEIVLGVTTVTNDGEAPAGEIRNVTHLDRAAISGCLDKFVGDIDQVPPAYAAVRHGGEKLYAKARRGEIFDAPARRVTIHGIELERWALPRLRLRVRCGSGTYIRALARDIGACLGVGGYLHALRRVSSGSFTVEEAVPVDGLIDAEDIHRAILPPDRAVTDLPAIVLAQDEVPRVHQGRAVTAESEASGMIRLYSLNGRLEALGQATGGLISPVRVFAAE